MNQTLSKPVVSRAQLEEVLAMRESLKALKSRIDLLEASIEKAEVNIIAQLEAGADVSQCGYDVAVKEVSRRYPAWKEHYVEKLGKAAADAILEATPAKVYKNTSIK